MESHGIFQPHLQQKGLVREYNSCGLEYFLGLNEVNKRVFAKGGLNKSMWLIIGLNCKGVK